jgi:hypothetical protein
LTGTFYFYSNAVEFVLEPGCSLAYFYRNPIYAVFSAHLMTIAINDFNAMAITGEKMSPQTIMQMLATIEAMERGDFYIPASNKLVDFKAGSPRKEKSARKDFFRLSPGTTCS